MELSKDSDIAKEMIREDIFRSSVIQIGLYTNSLNHLNPGFLKENFDSFAEFLPAGDVPYYRGIIQRGASVYYCEIMLEKDKRDLEDLRKQFGEEEKPSENQPVFVLAINKKENDLIYRQINGAEEAAFMNIALIPIILLVLVALIMCLVLLTHLF